MTTTLVAIGYKKVTVSQRGIPGSLHSRITNDRSPPASGDNSLQDIVVFPSFQAINASLKMASEADTKNIDEVDVDHKPDDVIEGIIEDAAEYSDAYFRKLRIKIDLFLLPLMWVCYGTQQADKTSLSVQAVFGLREDTGLVGEQFNWLSTIFYLSYLVCEFPGNWLIQKSHTGKFLSVVMVLWGVVVLCIAFAKNFAHLMILRTLQGALECTISPTFMLITGAWYTSQEHTLRSLIWGTSNAGMNIITGLCMYGIGLHAQKDPNGLAAVCWVFAKPGLSGLIFRTVERHLLVSWWLNDCLWSPCLVHPRYTS